MKTTPKTTTVRIDVETLALLRVLITHSNLAANMKGFVNELAVNYSDRVLADRPMKPHQRLEVKRATDAARGLRIGRTTRTDLIGR